MHNKIRKDATFKWLVDLQSRCSEIYKEFNWGKNYELLVEVCDMLEQNLANLHDFQVTRFANSVRFVFINLRKDYKPVTECLEKIINDNENGNAQEREKAVDVKRLLRDIKNKKTCLYLSGTADLYDQFRVLAQLCQIVNILPHERVDLVMDAAKHFEKMANHPDHTDCIKSSRLQAGTENKNPDTVSVKCYWPRYHQDNDKLVSKGKYMGVTVSDDHDKRGYQTRLGERNNRINFVTDPFDLAKKNLVDLSKKDAQWFDNKYFR